MNNDKTCENCKYFIKHYIKAANIRLQHPYGLGHCTNANMQKRISRKIVLVNLICDFWEPEEDKAEQKKFSISKEISEIKSRLDDITLILKSDK